MSTSQDHIAPGDFERVTGNRRKITFELGSPWLLGWCKWALVTEYLAGEVRRREVLASGRWKWRGRKARPFLGVIGCDVYWSGPST